MFCCYSLQTSKSTRLLLEIKRENLFSDTPQCSSSLMVESLNKQDETIVGDIVGTELGKRKRKEKRISVLPFDYVIIFIRKCTPGTNTNTKYRPTHTQSIISLSVISSPILVPNLFLSTNQKVSEIKGKHLPFFWCVSYVYR